MMLCTLISFFILSGCATRKLGTLNPDDTSVDLSKESIALLTMRVSNQYKPSYQPELKHIYVFNDDEANGEKFVFRLKEKYREVEDSFNEYLISFQLPPGNYNLRECFAQSNSTFFSLVMGSFIIPINSTFSIPPKQIIYLGHIDATVKERTSDSELRAGLIIPLIDQAVTGASTGTFVIKVTNVFENDMKLFKTKYPYLSQYRVKNLTLPAAYSTEEITGAFGIKLGDVFQPTLADKDSTLSDGAIMYQFEPQQPFRSFTNYYASITPKTHKIYSILGVGTIESDQVCKKEQAVVMSILKEKYGKSNNNNDTLKPREAELIDQGNRAVSTKCSGDSNAKISVKYYDNNLKDLAEKERIEFESSKVDAGGL